MHEEQIVGLIAELIASRQPGQGVLLGPGDDCAILHADSPLAVSSDMLMENIHFRTEYMTWYQIGSRAMAVNLSDLAAMGANPAYGLLALGLPANPAETMVKELLNGMLDMADGLSLVGGDTVKSPLLSISLTVMGRLGQWPLRRDQAKAGQQIWVTGPLGLSAAGLFVLQNKIDGPWHELTGAHISPIPRVGAGQILAEARLDGAVMDISDGLATDLARLCRASAVGAIVDEHGIVLNPSLNKLAQAHNKSAMEWALYGGEDFELLFTCWPEQAEVIIPQLQQNGLQPACVGEITSQPGVYLQDRNHNLLDIAFKGFDHFIKD